MGENKKILALDMGKKRVGVAISDALGYTAQGLKTIQYKGFPSFIKWLEEIIAEYGVGKIVVGLPKNMNGSLGKEAENILKMIEKMRKSIDIPIVPWDERLSTVEASRLLSQAGVRSRKGRKVVDKLASQIILQSYLEAKRG